MTIFRFERHDQPVASDVVFVGRMARHLLVALVIVAASLAIGIVGYQTTEHMGPLDAFLNAAMLLGGMGPVSALHTVGGKLFAGFYALFCGLVIVLLTGVVLAPALHRVLHSIHVEASDDG